jgi:hypothetical protein
MKLSKRSVLLIDGDERPDHVKVCGGYSEGWTGSFKKKIFSLLLCECGVERMEGWVSSVYTRERNELGDLDASGT